MRFRSCITLLEAPFASFDCSEEQVLKLESAMAGEQHEQRVESHGDADQDALRSRKVVVFVLSAERSGSTWVGYVLASHQDSAFLGEYFRGWDEELKVPCTICAAKGLAECEVLHGIEQVPAEQAFAWAFERTGKPVLIDVSKNLDWAARFTGGSDAYDVRLVHLIRDPRAWFASQWRRKPQCSASDLIAQWRDSNTKIQRFIEGTGLPHHVAFYDELATTPQTHFRDLFAFCGLEYDKSALEYWNFTHHGFAANGATSLILPIEVATQSVPHFLTQDDTFYREHSRKSFHDDRWKQEMSPDLAGQISADAGVTDVLISVGKELTDTGIVDVRPATLRSLVATRSALERDLKDARDGHEAARLDAEQHHDDLTRRLADAEAGFEHQRDLALSEAESLRAEVKSLQASLATVAAEKASVAARLGGIEASTSWRVATVAQKVGLRFPRLTRLAGRVLRRHRARPRPG